MKTRTKFFTFLTAAFLLASLSFGQNQDKYSELVTEAWSLYESQRYKESAEKYKAAFDQLDGKAYPNDRYNAACSYALAKDIENSFYHLFYLAENPKIKYRDLGHISTDQDLKILYPDNRWEKLIEIVSANKKEHEKDLDLPLVAILDTIYEEDQKYRRQIEDIEKKHGWESDEMKAHWKIINEKDSINLVKVKEILDTRGWLGSKVIGGKGNSTLFLVIQHSDLETQLKYLPMMREAVKLGNASASSLALLEDRVALRQGKRQIYGSQIGRDQESGEYYVSPLMEPEKVNERRAEVGLGTLEEYIANWDISWDVEKHKKRTETIESEREK
ncbi:MAG: DUF6624 domain-containing protein [Bacteroidota bacterium]